MIFAFDLKLNVRPADPHALFERRLEVLARTRSEAIEKVFAALDASEDIEITMMPTEPGSGGST